MSFLNKEGLEYLWQHITAKLGNKADTAAIKTLTFNGAVTGEYDPLGNSDMTITIPEVAGEQGPQGPAGADGDDGVGISSITSNAASNTTGYTTTTVTVKLTDGTSKTFYVNAKNGADGTGGGGGTIDETLEALKEATSLNASGSVKQIVMNDENGDYMAITPSHIVLGNSNGMYGISYPSAGGTFATTDDITQATSGLATQEYVQEQIAQIGGGGGSEDPETDGDITPPSATDTANLSVGQDLSGMTIKFNTAISSLSDFVDTDVIEGSSFFPTVQFHFETGDYIEFRLTVGDYSMYHFTDLSITYNSRDGAFTLYNQASSESHKIYMPEGSVVSSIYIVEGFVPGAKLVEVCSKALLITKQGIIDTDTILVSDKQAYSFRNTVQINSGGSDSDASDGIISVTTSTASYTLPTLVLNPSYERLIGIAINGTIFAKEDIISKKLNGSSLIATIPIGATYSSNVNLQVHDASYTWGEMMPINRYDLIESLAYTYTLKLSTNVNSMDTFTSSISYVVETFANMTGDKNYSY